MIQDQSTSAALSKLRGHKDNKIQDAFSLLAQRLDDLITQVGNLSAKVGEMAIEVDGLKGGVSGKEG